MLALSGTWGCMPGAGARHHWDALKAHGPLSLGPQAALVWTQSLPTGAAEASFALVRMGPQTQLTAHSTALSGDAVGTAADWADRLDADVVVFNAGFYRSGGGHVGWLKGDGAWFERQRHPDWQGLFVSGPADPALPAFQLVDLASGGPSEPPEAVAQLLGSYANAMQTMVLFDDAKRLRTRDSPRRAARSALGVDETGNLVFAISEGALTLAELAHALQALGLVRALNLDGGLEAQLAIVQGAARYSLLSRHGSSATVPDGPLVRLAAPALPSVWTLPLGPTLP